METKTEQEKLLAEALEVLKRLVKVLEWAPPESPERRAKQAACAVLLKAGVI